MYLKALIWESIIDSQASDVTNPSVKDEEYSCFTNEELREQLSEVDPERASYLHINDRRKMIRSIEVNLAMLLHFFTSLHKHTDLQKNRFIIYRIEENVSIQG